MVVLCLVEIVQRISKVQNWSKLVLIITDFSTLKSKYMLNIVKVSSRDHDLYHYPHTTYPEIGIKRQLQLRNPMNGLQGWLGTWQGGYCTYRGAISNARYFRCQQGWDSILIVDVCARIWCFAVLQVLRKRMRNPDLTMGDILVHTRELPLLLWHRPECWIWYE